MSVVTSYFGNWNRLRAKGFMIVSVSRYNPPVDWELKEFAPSKDLLFSYKYGKFTEEEYKEVYIRQLNQIGQQDLNRIVSWLQNTNVALCCYCGKDSFCHRHILAEWLNEKFNLNIKEFENEVCKTNS